MKDPTHDFTTDSFTWTIVDPAKEPVVSFRDLHGNEFSRINPMDANLLIQAIDQANGSVMVTDVLGNVYSPIRLELTAERLAEIQRRADTPGPVFTGEQVRSRLRAFQDEWDRTGGFDATHMREFLKKLEEGDPPRIWQGAS